MKLPIGTFVMARSNLDEPLVLGVLEGYENFEGILLNPAAIVKDMYDEKHLCYGIIVEYGKTLYKHLINLTPQEQWDYLA